jgi:hypothetical protein
MAVISKHTKTTAQIVLRDTETGRLIYVGNSPENTNRFSSYHEWRTIWCTKTNRKSWSPPGLREGKVNLITLGFYIINKLFRR